MPTKRGKAASSSAVEKKAKTGLAVGDDLPEFEVETDESKTISSKDLVKDSGAIIFFYPRANTGGCTTQACGFRDNYDGLVESGYKVFGMSADKPKSQANWKAKHKFKYPLLCDPSFEALKKLGVAKGDKGIRRSHIVIAKGGKIEQIHYDISPKESIAEAVKLITADDEAGKEAAEAAAAEEPEEPKEEEAEAKEAEEKEEDTEKEPESEEQEKADAAKAEADVAKEEETKEVEAAEAEASDEKPAASKAKGGGKAKGKTSGKGGKGKGKAK